MPDYTSKERIESKTTPGVFLTFIRMVEGHRVELRKRAAPISSKIGPLARRIESSQKDIQQLKKLNLDDQQKAKLVELQMAIEEMMEQADVIHQTELEPIWVKWGLLKIEGDITIDGEPATPDNIAFGPTELYGEIVTNIRERLGLSSDAIKNSSSPTTSTEPEGGQIDSTIAESAGIPETSSTPDATATAISQAA